MCTDVCVYTYAYTSIHIHISMYMYTHRQIVDLAFFSSLSKSTEMPWVTLALSHRYDRLVLAVWGGHSPHSHHNWHLWARRQGSPQSRGPAGGCSLRHLLQRCEFSLWVCLDWCWYNCFTFSVGEGKWARLTTVVVPCTSTWYHTRKSKLQRQAHAPAGSPRSHWPNKEAPNLKIKQQKRFWKPGN